MIRTQVQLPDALYHDAKRIAREQELTLAEVVRRGLEHMVQIYCDESRHGLHLSRVIGYRLPRLLPGFFCLLGQ